MLEKLYGDIGGKIKLNNLHKKSPRAMQESILKVVDVAGRDRNSIKNLSKALEIKELPKKILGKNIPQIFNSISSSTFGYIMTGALYGY